MLDFFQTRLQNLLQAEGYDQETVAAVLARRDYAEMCRALARLRGPVDAYFDKVMVMAEDERLRRNRLSLLARISATFLQMADFSKITTT